MRRARERRHLIEISRKKRSEETYYCGFSIVGFSEFRPVLFRVRSNVRVTAIEQEEMLDRWKLKSHFNGNTSPKRIPTDQMRSRWLKFQNFLQNRDRSVE